MRTLEEIEADIARLEAEKRVAQAPARDLAARLWVVWQRSAPNSKANWTVSDFDNSGYCFDPSRWIAVAREAIRLGARLPEVSP